MTNYLESRKCRTAYKAGLEARKKSSFRNGGSLYKIEEFESKVLADHEDMEAIRKYVRRQGGHSQRVFKHCLSNETGLHCKNWVRHTCFYFARDLVGALDPLYNNGVSQHTIEKARRLIGARSELILKFADRAVSDAFESSEYKNPDKLERFPCSVLDFYDELVRLLSDVLSLVYCDLDARRADAAEE